MLASYIGWRSRSFGESGPKHSRVSMTLPKPRRVRRLKELWERPCAECGARFTSTHRDAELCGNTCAQRRLRRRKRKAVEREAL
jgi:hypothetical protein